MPRDQRAHRVGRARALRQPVVQPLAVDLHLRRLGPRIVVPEDLDEAAVARRRASRSPPRGRTAASSIRPAASELPASLLRPSFASDPVSSTVSYRPTELPSASQHPAAPLALAAARHAAERLEHLPHLDELLQQPVHLFDARPAALRDPLPAAAVDDLVVAPLAPASSSVMIASTRAELLLVRLVVGELLQVAQSRDHPEDALERPHLLRSSAADRGSPRA